MNPNTSTPAQQSTSDPRQQAVDRLKQANNVLVTVSNNPSVDQLAACIGLTLMLNKLGKHGTAVYSGKTPSTIEFLKPEETIEKNTDSLRDFIIALDKSKADKLRYKVEDKIVQIFITPYHTSLSEKDLDFSLGDINVEVIIALGVHQQAELDQAITAHGRILHDATVISINTTPNNDLGSINWLDAKTSSLSEMVVSLGNGLGKTVFDAQIATALLTGIVAATDRFSNDKTFSETMNISAQLIDAGANQQLVATKLEEAQALKAPPPPPPPAPKPAAPPAPEPAAPKPEVSPEDDDGTLVIAHSGAASDSEAGEELEDENHEPISQIDIDREGTLRELKEKEELARSNQQAKASDSSQPPSQPPPGPGSTIQSTHNVTGGTSLIQGPPIINPGTLTANSQPEGLDPSTDPLSLPPVDTPLLKRDDPNLTPLPPASQPLTPLAPAPSSANGSVPDIQSARMAVEATAEPNPNEPIKELNAMPVFDNLHQPTAAVDAPPPSAPEVSGHQMLNMPVPPSSAIPDQNSGQASLYDDTPSGAPQPSPAVDAESSAPPVPPPITTQPPFL